MERNLSEMKIVYIAEKIKQYGIRNIFNKNLEQESYENTEIILNTLNDIFEEVVYFDSPKKFIKNIDKYRNHIIFPNWYGKNSRVRNSYIPTICEMNNLKYIGADGHCMTLTSDKYLSNLYMKKFGLNTSNSVFVKSKLTKHFKSKISNLAYPVIVKPNFEGSSIGITNNNICYTSCEAFNLINQLLPIFKEGLIIEEYIEGNEVKAIFFGNDRHIIMYGGRKVLINNNDFFKNEVLEVTTKSDKNITTTIDYTGDIDPIFVQNVIELFSSFGKVDFMRIDFRINDSGIYIIELSPDCSIVKNSTPHKVYQSITGETNYDSFLRFLINNSLNQYL